MADWNITLTKNQIELRGNFNPANVLIIVSDKGWDYRLESPTAKEKWFNSSGFDVRFSMNGVAWLTFDDWDEINEKVQWAQAEVHKATRKRNGEE